MGNKGGGSNMSGGVGGTPGYGYQDPRGMNNSMGGGGGGGSGGGGLLSGVGKLIGGLAGGVEKVSGILSDFGVPLAGPIHGIAGMANKIFGGGDEGQGGQGGQGFMAQMGSMGQGLYDKYKGYGQDLYDQGRQRVEDLYSRGQDLYSTGRSRVTNYIGDMIPEGTTSMLGQARSYLQNPDVLNNTYDRVSNMTDMGYNTARKRYLEPMEQGYSNIGEEVKRVRTGLPTVNQFTESLY